MQGELPSPELDPNVTGNVVEAVLQYLEKLPAEISAPLVVFMGIVIVMVVVSPAYVAAKGRNEARLLKLKLEHQREMLKIKAMFPDLVHAPLLPPESSTKVGLVASAVDEDALMRRPKLIPIPERAQVSKTEGSHDN